MEFAHKLMSTRGGTIALSGIAAVLAAGIFLVYLKRYRASVNDGNQPMPVLVAKATIEEGTPGSVIGREELFQPTTTPKSEVNEGAITDPGDLSGLVASKDIIPGEQLTIADFKPSPVGAITNKLTAEQRALTLSLDSAHGMVGNVNVGDHVDVFAAFNVKRLQPDGTVDPNAAERSVLKLVVEDVLVLGTPEKTAGGLAAGSQKSDISVRVTDEQAADIAFSQENGKVWVVLRPKTGATRTTPDIVTLETILFDVKPVNVMRSFGGRR
jgi:Flp pilus assembly protein CpaB